MTDSHFLRCQPAGMTAQHTTRPPTPIFMPLALFPVPSLSQTSLPLQPNSIAPALQ